MITGEDIFTGKKYECTVSTGDNIDSPICKKTEYSLIDINDEGYVTLLDDAGETKEDLKLPTDDNHKDIGNKLKELFEAGGEVNAIVQAACGQEKIVGWKEGKNWDRPKVLKS